MPDKTSEIKFRVTPEFKETLKARASEKGFTLTEYIERTMKTYPNLILYCGVWMTPEQAEHKRVTKQQQKQSLRDRGVCTGCRNRPLATADGWYCNPCLDRKQSPEKALKDRRSAALRRRQQRREDPRTHG